MLNLLKHETGERNNEEDETLLESETRSFYTPTKSVRISSAQNNDPDFSRNSWHFSKFGIGGYLHSRYSASLSDHSTKYLKKLSDFSRDKKLTPAELLTVVMAQLEIEIYFDPLTNEFVSPVKQAR